MNITMLDADWYRLAESSVELTEGRRYVAFDLEATGPAPHGDSVTQIGAVAVYHDGPRDDETFSGLVRPWKAIPEMIERLTGITNAAAAEAGDFATIYSEFARFCGDSALVTQCGFEFDFPLLDAECERSGAPRLSNERLDTKAMFAMLHPGQAGIFSTDFLSSHYRVDRACFRRHDALGDARLISRIFYAEWMEARSRNLRRMKIVEPLLIRRFVLPPL